MNPRFVYTSWVLFEHEPRARRAGTREYTAAELDAIADFSWPLEGLYRAIITGLQSLHTRWRRLPITPKRSPKVREMPGGISSNPTIAR